MPCQTYDAVTVCRAFGLESIERVDRRQPYTARECAKTFLKDTNAYSSRTGLAGHMLDLAAEIGELRQTLEDTTSGRGAGQARGTQIEASGIDVAIEYAVTGSVYLHCRKERQVGQADDSLADHPPSGWCDANYLDYDNPRAAASK